MGTKPRNEEYLPFEDLIDLNNMAQFIATFMDRQ